MSEVIRFSGSVEVGQGVVVRLQHIRNASGAITDPASVVGKFRDPGGTITSYTYNTDDELTRNAAGDYQFTFTPDEGGEWYVRIETGTPDSAYEASFTVAASQF